MEVFIAYTKDSSFETLKRTLESWGALVDADPIAIEIPEKKYELIRRVTAENMSKGDYILCDLGCVPNSEQVIAEVEKILKADPEVGMIKLLPDGAVRACRKGIVERWLPYKGGSYDVGHQEAYRMEGYKTEKCTLSYHRRDVH